MTPAVKQNLTLQDLCEIVEAAAGILGKNINDELMGMYESPRDFYEHLLEVLKES